MFCINSTKYQSCHVQSACTNDLFLPNPLDKRSALSTQVSEFTRQKRFQMEHARHAESSRSGISLGQLCSKSPQSQLSHSTHSSWSVQCEYRTPKDGKGGRSGAPLRALSGCSQETRSLLRARTYYLEVAKLPVVPCPSLGIQRCRACSGKDTWHLVPTLRLHLKGS